MLRDVSMVSLNLIELTIKINHPRRTAHMTTGWLGEEVQMEAGVMTQMTGTASVVLIWRGS